MAKKKAAKKADLGDYEVVERDGVFLVTRSGTEQVIERHPERKLAEAQCAALAERDARA